VSLAVLLSTIGAALLVARSIVSPLRLLSATAAQFGEGDFSARAPAADMPAIARLATSFNAMADRLEAREARMAEVDRIKSDFVSSVSHELRTPLTTIKALTRLLGRDSLTAEKRREYVDTIAAECDRQIDLVLNLLDLSRIEGGVFRTRLGRADVPEIVAACAKAAARGIEVRGHELVVELDADLPAACADAKAFGRVLGNVVENAIKYTPDGGRIVIAARAEGDWIEVSVTDNGRGIPPEDVPRLFDKFHRGRAFAAAAPQSGNTDEVDVSGVGLGLYLARNVMEQMGGRIGVETELGRGSAFTLYLRVWDEGSCGAAVEEEQQNAGATVGG
jgi:signal transduction histidine kinase